MHGYFVSLKLYDTARAIANPFAYAEHRERVVREKMEKMAETRIRAPKNMAANVKVNKGLADRIAKEEAREQARQDRKKQRKLDSAAQEGEAEKMDVDEQPNLISDPRFKALFQDPEFEVDESSREFALMNPSLVSKRRERTVQEADQSNRRLRTKTAVEEEEEEEARNGLSSDEEDDSEGDKTPDEDDSSEDDGMPFIRCF